MIYSCRQINFVTVYEFKSAIHAETQLKNIHFYKLLRNVFIVTHHILR